MNCYEYLKVMFMMFVYMILLKFFGLFVLRFFEVIGESEGIGGVYYIVNF